MQRLRFVLLAPTLAAALCGCASSSAPPSLEPTRALVAERAGHDYDWMSPSQPDTAADMQVQQQVQAMLRQPLSAEAAVRIALLRNPRLQIEYARLGIAAADVLEASRLSNPTLSTRVLEPLNGNFAALIGGGLTQSFSDLLLPRARKRMGEGEYQRSELLIAASLFDLTADVRAAWYSASGAHQVAAMRATAAAAAQTEAELAGKFHDAGNMNALQLNLEQAAATQTRLASTRARADAMRARTALNEPLGLGQEDDQWTLAEPLGLPLAHEDDAQSLLQIARSQRLDLLATRREVALLEQALETTRRYRWMGRVEAGVEAERDDDRARLVGPSVSLELPLFNQGQAAVARARARLDEQRGRLHALELSVANAVRLGVQRVQSAREIAEDYRAALIPERDAALNGAEANANYMLIGTFELLATKQEQYAAYQGYLEALRDYWLARIELMRSTWDSITERTATRGYRQRAPRRPQDSTCSSQPIRPDQPPRRHP